MPPLSRSVLRVLAMRESREPKRQCPLLVLSPRARSGDQVDGYKPFGDRLLVVMLRDVAAAISRQVIRRYDEHTVFTRFLFGKLTCDPPLIEELRSVPSSLVDCGLEGNDDVAAVDAARAALSHVASGAAAESKSIVLLCE